ncbi:MAG TPA: hypothetical protein VHE33_14180, partial [Acidobacteriaceae bacterium]|nr:hypothetical protein [Acidobacteriaceae bacterium]
CRKLSSHGEKQARNLDQTLLACGGLCAVATSVFGRIPAFMEGRENSSELVICIDLSQSVAARKRPRSRLLTEGL